MARVTVIMPAYNVAPYIEEAVESVLRQSFSDFELLIIDDGSSDGTHEVISRMSDSRIRKVRNESNIGLAATLNKGLSMAQTEYIARFDGDDLASPQWLEKNVGFLDSHPDYGICSSGFEWFGTRKGTVRYPERHADSMCQMLLGCTVIVPVMRLSVIESSGLRYRPSAFPAEDYDLWASCYRVTKVYNLQQTLFRYRMHTSQISTALAESQIVKSNEVRLRMLEWLNPDIGEEDRQYFVDRFAPGRIESESDVSAMRQFAERLVGYNEAGHYDADALARRLRHHIRAAVYAYSVREYSMRNFARTLLSGRIKYFTPRQAVRTMAKSILHRQA